MVFKNLHFETHFQKFAFSDPQNGIVVVNYYYFYYIFSVENSVCVNDPKILPTMKLYVMLLTRGQGLAG